MIHIRFIEAKSWSRRTVVSHARKHLSPSSAKTRWQTKEVSFKRGADGLLVLYSVTRSSIILGFWHNFGEKSSFSIRSGIV